MVWVSICSPVPPTLLEGLIRTRVSWDLSGDPLAPLSAGLSSWYPSNAFPTDSVATGGEGQVRGEEHLEGPSRASGQAPRGGGGLLMHPVNHQPHQELVGPGDAQGWREVLIPGPETQNGCCCCAPPTPASLLRARTHPRGVGVDSSAISVTWEDPSEGQ